MNSNRHMPTSASAYVWYKGYNMPTMWGPWVQKPTIQKPNRELLAVGPVTGHSAVAAFRGDPQAYIAGQ